MDLILFYESGRTFRFQDVTDLELTEDRAVFHYVGKSTGMKRVARFEGFIGHSVHVYEKPNL